MESNFHTISPLPLQLITAPTHIFLPKWETHNNLSSSSWWAPLSSCQRIADPCLSAYVTLTFAYMRLSLTNESGSLYQFHGCSHISTHCKSTPEVVETDCYILHINCGGCSQWKTAHCTFSLSSTTCFTISLWLDQLFSIPQPGGGGMSKKSKNVYSCVLPVLVESATRQSMSTKGMDVGISRVVYPIAREY